MLRLLVLAPGSNPDGITGPLIGYSHAEALAHLHHVTLAIYLANEDGVRRKQAPFRGVEVVNPTWLDWLRGWIIRYIFKNNYRSQVLTALSYIFCADFEWRVWRQTRTRIRQGEFDAVLRLLPISSVLPSPFAFFLRRGPIPFVIGPLNGGLPWPKGFSQADKQKEWISNLRSLYRFLPLARSTYAHAAAVIVGSSHTYSELAPYREKLFFVPGENGINPLVYPRPSRHFTPGAKLELIFLGGLAPFKGCDLALRAAAPLLKSGQARFTVVGNGPERTRLEQLTTLLGIDNVVSFCGMLRHRQAMQRLGMADVLVFPSVHEFGGAVVFEALAMGAVPVVVNFGGPGDIVSPEIGYKVRLTSESDIAFQIQKILTELAQDRNLLEQLRREGMRYARENLTWERKAQMVSQILLWAVRKGPKPNLQPPQREYEQDRDPTLRSATSIRNCEMPSQVPSGR